MASWTRPLALKQCVFITLLLILPNRLSAFFHARSGIQAPSIRGQRNKDVASCVQLQMAVQESSSEESRKRRQLLFSILAAATSSAAVGPSASQAHETNTALKILDSPLEDWSNVEILKPPTDDRDYLAYVLSNGLKVVICSDPTSIEAGAAMDVHVGACSDPVKVPGLAHFNEHMLFLGTKKYPKEDSFEEFLSANGGASNAYTASEDTVYHFTLQAEADAKLEEGLDRFGSFFASPLFTESATGRELNAIESENAKNLQSDNFRIYQIEKGRQTKTHPHSKFFTGNKETLLDNTKREGLDLRKELIAFYNKYYSANQMTLAVVGPQSVDTLKRMVEKGFGSIPNRNVPEPEKAWSGIIPPYGGSSVIPSFGNAVKVVPVQELRQVSVTWPIIYNQEEGRSDALLIKQANYAAHLIGHEGPGSLLSYLKKRGWVNSVTASSESELSDFETFEVTVGLTKKGLSYVDQIIEAVFSYVKLIRDRGIPRFIFSEVLQLEELQWRYSSKRDVSGYVQSLATSLKKYPPSLCVAGPRRLALTDGGGILEASSAPRTAFSSESQFDYTRKLCESFADYLTVDNAMVTIMSKSFQGQTNEKEKWYGTDYRVDPIPVATLNQWRSCADVKKMGIDYPKPNPFIPTEEGLVVKYPPAPFDRFRKRSFEERTTPIPPPAVIRDDGPNGRWTVYYKPDNRFGQPKAFVVFQLLNNRVFSSAKNAALANFYEFCISDKLGEYAYDGKRSLVFLEVSCSFIQL
jgi:insulysin